MADYGSSAEAALRAPDGWSGFCAFLERLCVMQAADRGLKDVLTRTFPNARALEAHRARAYELWVQVVGRAQAEGSLRPDFVPQDLVLLLLMANAGVVAARRGPSSTSRRKKPASRASRRAVRRTTRSPRSYSSVRAPSIITCARCSASST